MIRKLFKLVTNYYLVIKTCWVIVLFQVIGYAGLVMADQGQDILRSLNFGSSEMATRQAIFVLLACIWWSWQSWRSARALLHFTGFNFWTYQPTYSFRAKVIIPRVLGITPYYILAYALHLAGAPTYFPVILISLGVWSMVFFIFRRDLIIWARAKHFKFGRLIPSYIPIKSGAYSAQYIWTKQKHWLYFRFVVTLLLFILFTSSPIVFGRWLGDASILLLAFGTWLILATVINFVERYLHFPISITLVLLAIAFSFFNNNHAIRTSDNALLERPSTEEAFEQWISGKLEDTEGDSIPVYLVAAEGGGIRSAYWTAKALSSLHENNPGFSDHVFAMSGVSGGALGVTLFNTMLYDGEEDMMGKTTKMLSQDFLSPVTAYFLYPDLLQKFIPVAINSFDRSKVLEYSWESSWEHLKENPAQLSLTQPFVQTFSNPLAPNLILNATHAETGHRAVVSTIDLDDLKQNNVVDLFRLGKTDVPISTAVGISSRFPFLTPPAMVKDSNGNFWGNVVDGGYYENLGITTLTEVYHRVRKYSDENGYPVKFHVILLRNTALNPVNGPIQVMPEILSPIVTVSRNWANNADETLRLAEQGILENGDELVKIQLHRPEEENIPLGWYLSSKAVHFIDQKLPSEIDKAEKVLFKKKSSEFRYLAHIWPTRPLGQYSYSMPFHQYQTWAYEPLR